MLVASPANSGGITKRTWNGITIMESNESLKVIKLLAWKLSKKSTSFQKNFHSSRKVSRNPLVFALLFMVIPTADHREIKSRRFDGLCGYELLEWSHLQQFWIQIFDQIKMWLQIPIFDTVRSKFEWFIVPDNLLETLE